jgi:hypothetical protein
MNNLLSVFCNYQNSFNPDELDLVKPTDASAGVPSWIWICAFLFFTYIGIRVYVKINKDKSHKK